MQTISEQQLINEYKYLTSELFFLAKIFYEKQIKLEIFKLKNCVPDEY